ncbi:MAG: TonB-dependent receptor [Caulobacterales bacterium]|nr:TonB-dependent receptor [Caulobacterales bacterium]
MSGLKCGVASAALLSLGMAHGALAQNETPAQDEAERGEDYFGAIIVTAQKREQNLAEVPMSIDVLTGAALERQNVGEFDSISQFVPNFRFADAGAPGTYSFVIIRGLANGLGTVEPRVSVYLDGVPTGDFYSLNSELVDIERIEILRGPQSTLYGLNSQAGVINIVSNLPDDEFRAKGTLEYNSLEEVTAAGSVSGPVLEDILSLGVAASIRDGGDYVDGVTVGEELGAQEAFSARVQALFTPTDDLEFLFTASHQDLDQDSGRIQLPLDQAAYNLANGTSVGDFEYAADAPGFAETQTRQASLRGSYAGDGFDIVSVTSYRDFEENGGFDVNHNPSDLVFDFGFGPLAFSIGESFREYEQFYQELRVQSNGEGPLEWTLGASYFSFDDVSGGALIGEGLNIPISAGTRDGTTWGVYGQGTYRLMEERLGLTTGLRYEETSRAVADTLNVVEFDSDDSIVLPRFVVDYRFADELFAYASVTRGWLSGGAEVTGDPANALYDAETSWVYEIGVSGDIGDGLFGYRAAGHYTEANDYQDLVLDGAFTSFLSNAEKATITGFEVELSANPIDQLNVSAGFGYTDAKYDSFLLQEATDVRIDGNTIVGVPEYDFSVIANYSLPRGFYVQGELIGAGEFALDQLNTAFAEGYEAVNLRLGFENDTFAGNVFVENIADEQYFLNGIVDPFAGAIGVVGNPRIFGVRLSATLD